jgi:serine protease DegQ
MIRKLWLIFAQATTIALAVLFVFAVLWPESLPVKTHSVTIRETSPEQLALSGYSFNQAVIKATPAVVNIFTSQEVKTPAFMEEPLFQRFFGFRFETEPQRVSSLGSGVIVSPEGYILTNDHVVAAADEIEVALADGRKVSGRVIGTDPDTDLAVVKIELKDLSPITFGHSDKIRVGDIVLAIGNPFGVGQTVTMGIVSALGRNHLGINTFENFIQTDAPINPGNSGGALVDISGNLIGVNSAIYSRTGGSMGIGFAIPANLAKQVMEQIILHGSVTRGWIGVEVQDITPELAESFGFANEKGALIAGVLDGGPADQAGVKPGDVLQAINGKSVSDSADMLDRISQLPPNTSANLALLRGKSKLNARVRIGKRPKARSRGSELP